MKTIIVCLLLAISNFSFADHLTGLTKKCKKTLLQDIGADYAFETCDRGGQHSKDCLRQKRSCYIDSLKNDRTHYVLCDVGMGFDSSVEYTVSFQSLNDHCLYKYHISNSYDDSTSH